MSRIKKHVTIRVVFYSAKAYFNANGRGQIHILNHDVKRAILDSKMVQGTVVLLSMQATVSLKLMENEKALQEKYFKSVFVTHQQDDVQDLSRRSQTGGDAFHLMAARDVLSLALIFQQGKLLLSPFHDILALDFEPRPGRREIVIGITGDVPQQQGQPPPRKMA